MLVRPHDVVFGLLLYIYVRILWLARLAIVVSLVTGTHSIFEPGYFPGGDTTNKDFG